MTRAVQPTGGGTGGLAIDGVLVINLDRRPDRWASFQQVWADRLPWDRVERLSAVDGRVLPGYGQAPWFRGRRRDPVWGGRAGCALSHRRALTTARDRGWETVLILEDDALPTDALGQDAALARTDWSVLYLGCAEPRGPFQDQGAGIVRISGALDAHAYVVRSDAREWILVRMPDELTIWPWMARKRALDRWYRRVLAQQFPVMAIWPPVVVQGDGGSDISQRSISHSATGAYAAPTRLKASPLDRIRPLANHVEAANDQFRASFKRWFAF